MTAPTSVRSGIFPPSGHSLTGGFYKPVKVAVTCKLDTDIVAWLKREGKGYQTQLNAILCKEMMAAQ